MVAAFAPAQDKPRIIPQGDPFASDGRAAGSEDLEATRVLENLQFGRNYVKD